MFELIFNVEGMMCSGCENRVKNALMAIDGVEEVVANHANGTVIVNSSVELNKEEIAEAIDDLGFNVKED